MQEQKKVSNKKTLVSVLIFYAINYFQKKNVI